jgi:hypothetical protein
VLAKRNFFVERELLRKTGEYAGHAVNDLPEKHFGVTAPPL